MLFLLLLFLVKKVSDNVVCFLEAIRLSPLCKTSKDFPFFLFLSFFALFRQGEFRVFALEVVPHLLRVFHLRHAHRTLHL